MYIQLSQSPIMGCVIDFLESKPISAKIFKPGLYLCLDCNLIYLIKVYLVTTLSECLKICMDQIGTVTD